MLRRHRQRTWLTPRFSFILLVLLLLSCWLVGGASRADAAAQIMVRGAAWIILVSFVLAAPQFDWRRAAPVAMLLAGAIILVVVHLIPLPPAVWTQLPGRQLLSEVGPFTGSEQPWRPLSISPGATRNALSSLIIPLTTLVLAAGLTRADHYRIAVLLLGFMALSSVLGLLEFSGAQIDYPLVNDVPGFVSATFANRNHFALFIAIGCLLTITLGFRANGDERGSSRRWQAIAAIGLLVFFLLIILATGSRTGMLLGALATGMGFVLVRRQISSVLAQMPKKVAVGMVGLIVLAAAATVLSSVALERAVSVDRAFSLEMEEDLRRRTLPTVLEMVRLYFPAGSGFGTFDPVYRISEQNEHLSRFYFNHAHNDLLEIVLDGGLAGAALLVGAIAWWLWSSICVWRSASGPHTLLGRLGSAILLLVLLASVTDYPVRTPMIMALVILGALWLHSARWPDEKTAAPPGPGSRKVRIDRSAGR